MEFRDDMIVDIPKFYEYLGQVLSGVFVSLGSMPERQSLLTASPLKALVGTPSMGKVVGALLSAATAYKVSFVASSSGLNFS